MRHAVAGVLLCGGRSERMGADKARLTLGEAELIDYPLRCLRAVADTVVLACGPRPRYAERGLPLALDGLPDGGPLAGLAAGLSAAEELGAEWVAVLACDMPRAEATVLAGLLQRAREQDLDACLLGLERGSQPTYAVYHVRCAAAVGAALGAGERRLVAFHGDESLGRPLRVQVVPVAELGAGEAVARNVNTLEELDAERAALAAGGRR